jgi:hypothetical protein
MKVINSLTATSFGGLNFVLKELSELGIDKLLDKELPKLSSQSKYTWKDIFYTYWSIPFCGGDCAEDISINLRHAFTKNPFVHSPSPDRLLNRLKELSVSSVQIDKYRSKVINEFSINDALNRLNVKLLKKLLPAQNRVDVLDYDNTFVYTEKADAKNTFTGGRGYCPGVGTIGNNIVYVENRNGNCVAHYLQDETIKRMFEILKSQNIKVDAFRADSASYQFSTITTINRYVNKLYVKARMNGALSDAIKSIKEWTRIEVDGNVLFRSSTRYIPFKEPARKTKQKDILEEYRLVVTKEKRKDGQIDLFTGEACTYSAILTNDYDKTDNQIVFFYNQRGKQEREFDILKNDFAWNKLPFSKIEQNTVFMILMAMCRNIYNYLIHKFSRRFKFLSPHFRIKKFIFRFICIPGKWIKTGRAYKLRLYGEIAFKT